MCNCFLLQTEEEKAAAAEAEVAAAEAAAAAAKAKIPASLFAGLFAAKPTPVEPEQAVSGLQIITNDEREDGGRFFLGLNFNFLHIRYQHSHSIPDYWTFRRTVHLAVPRAFMP